MVNDHLVSFNEIFKMIMNSSLNVILPPSFIKPPPKNPSPEPNPTPGHDSKQNGKGEERKLNKSTGDSIIKNAALITEFLIKEGKDWKQDFAGKCSSDCPKWDNSSCAPTGTFGCELGGRRQHLNVLRKLDSP